jgi:hypothetical protein
MADWNYIVTHYYDVGGSTGTQAITDDVISIPKFTDTGSGEVNEATIVLDADGGNYISDDATGKRIIQQNDVIKLYVTDSLPAQGTQQATYEKYFNVVKKIPIKSKSEGVRVQLELLGVENWLQRINYIKPHYFENPAEVFQDICNLYNSNKGTGMPTLINFQTDKTSYPNSKNNLPQYVSNIYDFGNNEDNCFDRISDVIDKVGASAADGGILDFFDFKAEHDNNGNDIETHVFSSGNQTAVDGSGNTTHVGGQTIITIDNSTNVNVGESDGGINSEEGNLINSWGAVDAGSLPIDFSIFKGRQQWWNLYFPEWVTGQTYPAGAKVSYVDSGTRYNYRVKTGQTSTGSTPPTTTSKWEVLTSALYYGNAYKYSPWTAQRKIEWINGLGDPTASYGLNVTSASPRSPMCFDHNIVCRDTAFSRTFVDQIATSPGGINEKLLYDDNRNGTGTALYRGLRVLCSGDPVVENSAYFGYSSSNVTASTVKDDNGRLIKNSVLEYTGTKWIVKYRPYEDQFASNSTPIKFQVVVLFEGRTYEFYKDGSNQTWQNFTDDDNGNDCLHPLVNDSSHTPAYTLYNVPGVLADYTNTASVTDVNNLYGWDTTNTNSAIEVRYNWSPYDIWNIDGVVLAGDLTNRNTQDYYQCGAWLSMRFPFPTTTAQSPDTTAGREHGKLIGDWYGGGTNTANPHEPATLDTQNMHLTHDGKRGFNKGLSSEDFGQISGVSFMTKLWFLRKRTIDQQWEDVDGDDGSNFKMRCVLIDTDDNVVTQDFVIPFNNTWTSITLPVSGFQIYRGRKPRYNSSVVHDLFPPKGLDVQDIFIWRNVKMMSIFVLEPYDEYGRYHPGGSAKLGTESVYDQVASSYKLGYSEKEMRLAVDALHFTKPLLVNTGNITGRVIDPDFIQRPDIGNYEQLKSDAQAEKQMKSFQHVEFDTTTTGRFDIGFGDYFNLQDEDIIPSNLQDSSNTIKLVAKRIEYSITKPLNGKGGFLRRIRGVRRFT